MNDYVEIYSILESWLNIMPVTYNMYLFHIVVYTTNIYQIIYPKIVPSLKFLFFWDPKNFILLFKMCIFTKLFIKNIFNNVNYWKV
jgi:hypothetical protein